MGLARLGFQSDKPPNIDFRTRSNKCSKKLKKSRARDMLKFCLHTYAMNYHKFKLLTDKFTNFFWSVKEIPNGYNQCSETREQWAVSEPWVSEWAAHSLTKVEICKRLLTLTNEDGNFIGCGSLTHGSLTTFLWVVQLIFFNFAPFFLGKIDRFQ